MNPAKFAREVRQETKRVVWPSRKETTVSTIIVLVIGLISAIFFVSVDSIIAYIVQLILGIGG